MQFTTIQLWILLTFTPKLKKETNQKTPQIYAGGGVQCAQMCSTSVKKIFTLISMKILLRWDVQDCQILHISEANRWYAIKSFSLCALTDFFSKVRRMGVDVAVSKWGYFFLWIMTQEKVSFSLIICQKNKTRRCSEVQRKTMGCNYRASLWGVVTLVGVNEHQDAVTV